MNFLTSTTSKIVIGVFVIIAIYYFLVYYKGGNAYVSSISGAANSGVNTLMQSNNRSYAYGG